MTGDLDGSHFTRHPMPPQPAGDDSTVCHGPAASAEVLELPAPGAWCLRCGGQFIRTDEAMLRRCTELARGAA
jgi:hypothetical protein